MQTKEKEDGIKGEKEKNISRRKEEKYSKINSENKQGGWQSQKTRKRLKAEK